MRTVAIMIGCVCALLSSLIVVGSGSVARAAELPAYFKEIVGTQAASPAEIGTKNVLQLNSTMFELYGEAGQMFKKNILARHPLILGLFSGTGDSCSIAPGWRRSSRRRFRPPMNCSNPSATAPWRWPRWWFPIWTVPTT
jgi:hypothetical protein